MARTYLRLAATTGSLVDVVYSGSITSAAQASAVAAPSGEAILGELAGAIGRISGKTGSLGEGVTNATAGHFYQNLHITGSVLDFNQASAVSTAAGNLTLRSDVALLALSGAAGVTLDADSAAGVLINSRLGPLSIGDDANTGAINVGTGAGARTITIGNGTGATGVSIDVGTGDLNLGTNATAHEVTIGPASAATDAGVTIRANTGGIDIDCSRSTGALSLDTAGGAIEIGVNAAAGAINIGTNATARTITIGNATTTTTLDLDAGTGGIDADTTGAVNIASSKDGASAVTLTASAGGVDITATNAAAGEDINITATGSSVNISATEAAADAITIDASGNAGIDITAGNAANDSAANLDIIAMNNLTIDAQGTDSGDGVNITLGTDTATAGLRINNDSAAEKFKVDALGDMTVGRDASITRNLSVSGDFFVAGATTTVSSSNLIVKDPIAAFGIASSSVSGGSYTLGPVGDRGFVFPMATAYAGSPVFFWDNSGVVSSGVPQGTFRTAYAISSGSTNSITKVGPLGLDTGALTTTTIVASGIVKTDDITDATTNADGSLQTDGGLSVKKAIFNSTAATLAAASGIVTMGSTTAATVSALGVVNVNNATEATDTTDGSLQTDGGLSVAKSIVGGIDLDLVGDGAIINVGTTEMWTATHANADNTLTVSSNNRLAFGNAGDYVYGDGTDIVVVGSADIVLLATDDVNIPVNVGLVYGDDGEKIEGDGTNLTIQSSAQLILSTSEAPGYINVTSPYLQLGNGVVNEARIRLLEDGTNGSNYITFGSPATLGGNYTFTLPNGNGTSGYMLTTNGNGVTSWSAAGGANIQKGLFEVTAATIAKSTAIEMDGSTSGINLPSGSIDFEDQGDDASLFTKLDVYVNGQMMSSGTLLDYTVSSNQNQGEVTFNFGLVLGDNISVLYNK